MLHKDKLIKYNEQVYLIHIDCEDDITDFFKIAAEKDTEFEDVVNESVKNRLCDLFKVFKFPITVIYEPYYVDKIYRDEFYRYYSKKHFNISRNTKRLIFINGKYEKEELLMYDQELHKKIENNLIGMVVLKPTQTIGRMLINPNNIRIPKCYLRTTTFEILMFGKIYSIEAFPFSGQDSEVMTCAEVNIWQIMEYFGSRYNNYKTLLPSEMFDILKATSDVRILPSDGLTVEQESFIFMRSGLSPKIYYKRVNYEDGDHYVIQDLYSEPSFEEILSLYIESGIPVLVNLREKNKMDGENHCVTFIGHGDKASQNFNETQPHKKISFPKKYIDKKGEKEYNNIDVYKSWKCNDEYVIMEDHSIPYQIKSVNSMQFAEDGIVWEFDSFVVPLYKHVFMVAEDAYDIVMQLIEKAYEEIIDTIACNKMMIRLYLTTSRAYKEFRVNTANSLNEQVFFANATYPKFLWVCEYTTSDLYSHHKAVGEFVLDATSSKHNIAESVISIRQGNSITHRGPNDSFENAVLRLDITIDDEFSMYEQNNLKFVNFEGRQE